MKPGDLLGEQFRVEAPLRGRGREGGFLVTERRRGRQPRWVLKKLPFLRGRIPRDRLRNDILEVASLKHERLLLPSFFGLDPRRQMAFLLRPYVAGSDLLSAGETRSVREIIPWMIAAAEALGLLHSFGLLHRNVKASNFIVQRKALFSRQPREAAVCLSDPAWWPEGEGARGKMEAVAPELRAGAHATPASDLYALGSVFYQLLTQRTPQLGQNRFPPPPTQHDPELPLDAERVVMKLLNPEPARRYQDARAVADDLRRLPGPKAPDPPVAPDAFLGRARELSLALKSLTEKGRPSVVAISGEAGVGKSAFLRRLGLEAQLEGHRTVSWRCFHDGFLRQKAAAMDDGGGGKALLKDLPEIFSRPSAEEPCLFLVDDAHLADAPTVDFLASRVRALRRRLAREPFAGTCPPSLAISFRNESPFRSILRPLLDAFGSPQDGSSLVLQLSGLDGPTVENWLERALGPRKLQDQVEVLRVSGGNPFAIREAIRLSSSGRSLASSALRDLELVHRGYLSSLDEEQRRILQALAIVARPSPPALLSELALLPGPRVRSRLRLLLQDGTLLDGGGKIFFQHGSFQAWLLQDLPEKEQQRLHRRVASALGRRRTASVDEVASHWLNSDAPARGIRAVILAARQNAQRHDSRRALFFYSRALDLLPRKEGRLRRAVAEEAAEACAQTGDASRGMEILTALLETSGTDRDRARLHGRMGSLQHRAGNIEDATRHIEAALSFLADAVGREPLRGRLRLESELAEIACNKGDYERAEAICQRALQQIAAAKDATRDPGVRREQMVLLETQGHLRLRRFEFQDARKHFEQSLKLSGEIEAPKERSLILNNLGILCIQENRFKEAIECYRKAEKLSSRLGDEQGLQAILSNLAILYAKTGKLEAADEALGRARGIVSGHTAPRTRFLRFHSAGMVDHLAGRYGSAIENFRGALELGEELNDRHTIAFDLVYLGECHLFRGESKAAKAAFDRALGIKVPSLAPLKAMVEARKALLSAQRGGEHGAESSSAARDVASPSPSPEGNERAQVIGYLEAWNKLFLGWAERLSRRFEAAEAHLEEARAFFNRALVPLGEVHAALELLACDIERGRLSLAEKRLRKLKSHFAPGKGVLKSPMLAARFLAYDTWLLLEQENPDFHEAASLLVEAESYLIGRHLLDLEALARLLRRRLHEATLERKESAPISAQLSRPASGGVEVLGLLKEEAANLLRQLEEEMGAESTASLRQQLREFEDHLDGARRAQEAHAPSPSELVRSQAIVGKSEAVRKVVAMICRLSGAALPVLVSGETGTGKELVARAIHGEGPRRSAPFVSLGCAALPGDLLEAELFGYSQGAFTGASKDKQGLLQAAQGGTFFFDEVGELPMDLQAKLLNLFDRPGIRPLGGTEEVPIDVRFIFSTNKDLRELVDQKKFRPDLFYRLSALEIRLPPLRERLEDLPCLVEHFRGFLRGERESPAFEEDAMEALAGYSWPGNVRELQNAVFRLALTSAERIRAEDVRRALGNISPGNMPPPALFSSEILRSRPIPELIAELEREHLARLYRECGGDLKVMGRKLGIKQRALYDRFQRLGIRPRDLRKGARPGS